MSEIRPAATVVLIRDGEHGLETLLLRRNTQLDFAGGSWVFPGGRIDQADYQDDPEDTEQAAYRAAVRETAEEANLVIDQASLHYFAHWTTPPVSPKRYATWFFICGHCDASPVTVDGSEITAHLWIAPHEALAKQRAKEIKLTPPTFVTLAELSDCQTIKEALQMYERRQVCRYQPHFSVTEGGICMLYEGDAGYETSDPTVSGPRHRFWMIDSGWRFEKNLAS